MFSSASVRRAAILSVATLALAACQAGSGDPAPDATASATATASPKPDVAIFESGPDSPLGYGLQVPAGATQLGPLSRIRSEQMIKTYAPDLQAAQAQRDADRREDLAERRAENPDEVVPVPVPTPDVRPSQDSFNPLEEQPRPDTVISTMRIDGSPTVVVLRMMAQISAMLPGADVPMRLTEMCTETDMRITGCTAEVTGTTADDREVRVVVNVDPGNVETRTSAPSALRQPVMTLQIRYVGDVREGQRERESSEIGEIAEISPDVDPEGLIWPSMDLDAPADTPLVDGFVAPEDAIILLSGFSPQFVELTTDKAATADLLAQRWVEERIEGEVAKDVAVELNEVNTTYTGSSEDGTYYRATYVLSARGNYVLLRVYPPDAPR
ncbi:hypothetical protein [Aeromicrobium sp. CF3.5]|uniref:hypothetical protein n=1 Tax=Aeromicrobium sp. CF3.5 TaxID=3373078 RepID=UPI003EE67631